MEWNLFWTALGSVISIVSLVYLMFRNFKKDIIERFDKIEIEIKEVKLELKSIDQRLSRLEGSFLERGQWEGRLYSMQKCLTEEKIK